MGDFAQQLNLFNFNKERKVGLNDGAIYHCAGDSIVSTCLVNIIGQMLPINENTLKEITENYVKSLRGNYELENK